jgi:hypothetical protein
VVGDHKQVAAVEQEFASQRFSAVKECQIVRIDAARAVLQLRARTTAHYGVGGGGAGAGTIDEAEASIGAEQEALPDVAAGCAAIIFIQDRSGDIRGQARQPPGWRR